MNSMQLLGNTLLNFLTRSKSVELAARDFKIMTGMKKMAVDEKTNTLFCTLPLSVTGRKWNFLKITLNGNDLVDVTCGKVTVKGTKVVHHWENLYGEDVYSIFREATGVETRLPRFA